MPALFNSLVRGQPESCPIVNTIADSIAIPGVGVNAFCTIKSRLDKMVCIKLVIATEYLLVMELIKLPLQYVRVVVLVHVVIASS